MALMAAAGEIGPMPDCAVFADTGAEPKHVYEHLAWLRSPGVLPFPVHVVSAGSLRDDLMGLTTRTRFTAIPYFLVGDDGRGGMGRRQCTREYKVDVISREIRRLLGKAPRDYVAPGSAEVWIGISTDEIQRMKPARRLYMTNRHPLIERNVSRVACLRWLKAHEFAEPQKSACTFCPYHDNSTWRRMRDHDPVSWADAVAMDAALRENRVRLKLKAVPYLHRSLVPLDQVDLSTAADRGQLDMFNNECEGMCGV